MTELSSQPRLELLPAVDVADGKAVRLTQGEAGTETSYGDPTDAAADFVSQGAEWIHLVDLDAAFGRGNNGAVIRKVIRSVRGVKIELSGACTRTWNGPSGMFSASITPCSSVGPEWPAPPSAST